MCNFFIIIFPVKSMIGNILTKKLCISLSLQDKSILRICSIFRDKDALRIEDSPSGQMPTKAPSISSIGYGITRRVIQYRWWITLSPTPFVCSPLMHPYMERVYTPDPQILLHIRIPQYRKKIPKISER